MDLAAMTPHGELSTTGYCLAAPGREYLIYQPAEGPFRVQLPRGVDTTLAVEWFDPKTGTSTKGQPVKVAGKVTFTSPFAGDAVLYLKTQ
jgi:hypothetical protein